MEIPLPEVASIIGLLLLSADESRAVLKRAAGF